MIISRIARIKNAKFSGYCFYVFHEININWGVHKIRIARFLEAQRLRNCERPKLESG